MKTKTRKIIGLACAILLIVLVQAIGITYAKYIASEKGTGQAEIAKWGFEIVKEGQQKKTINLASTISKESLTNGKIAPGTSGEIIITVDGKNSEVDLDYTLEFLNEKNKPDNLTFAYKGKVYKSLSEIVANGKIEHYNENREENVTILWAWNYETGTTDEEKRANNIIDTENANTITQYTFDIIATATQSE